MTMSFEFGPQIRIAKPAYIKKPKKEKKATKKVLIELE